MDLPRRYADCNPLNYFVLDKVQQKNDKSRHFKPFLSMQKLKEIIRVWDECSIDLLIIGKTFKQLLPRLRTVYERRTRR